MSRRRYVSTTMATDKRLNALASEHGDFAAMLYTWMIPHAEDDGGINGDLDEFMATVIPMRRDKSIEDVRAALTGMADLGLIDWDQDADVILFPPASFYKHQSYISAERRAVATDKRGSAQNAADQRKTPQISANASVMEDSDSTPQNAAKQRGSAQNAASSSFKSSFKSSSSSGAEPPGGDAAFKDAYGSLVTSFGGEITRKLADEFTQIAEDYPVEAITGAIRECRAANKRCYPSNVLKFLIPPEPPPVAKPKPPLVVNQGPRPLPKDPNMVLYE